jgi:hypothetical protein
MKKNPESASASPRAEPTPLDQQAASRDAHNLDRALIRLAEEEDQAAAHPSEEASAALTRDPSDPLAQPGSERPKLPADDEQLMDAKAAETGRELADSEQLREGQRQRP